MEKKEACLLLFSFVLGAFLIGSPICFFFCLFIYTEIMSLTTDAMLASFWHLPGARIWNLVTLLELLVLPGVSSGKPWYFQNSSTF